MTSPMDYTDAKTGIQSAQIQVTAISNDKIEFALWNTDLSVANSLRRVMIAEVPTFAIESVDVQENSSALCDEFLAHRLGLVPLTSPSMDMYSFPWECGCDEGCSKCTVNFVLSVRNTGEEVLNVTSADLQVQPWPDEPTQDSIRPVHNGTGVDGQDPVLLVKLGRNQEVVLSCAAKKGMGKEHAKWCPVAVATFQQDPDVRIDGRIASKLTSEQKHQIASFCPSKVFSFNDTTSQLEVSDSKSCTYCKECINKATDQFDVTDVEDLLYIAPKPNRFNFSVEGTGCVAPEEIVMSALEIIKKKADEIDSHLADMGAEGFGVR